MIVFENTLDIKCSTQDVFTFVSNFENLPKWNYYVLQVTQTSDGVPGKGTSYHQVRKNDQQDFTIIDFAENQHVTIQSTASTKPTFKRTIEFVAEGKKTILIDRWQLDLGNPLVNVLGKSRVKNAVAENLHKLKQLLETGRTQLQDGRIVEL